MSKDYVALSEATLIEIRDALDAASAAADGDSNDSEIAALQDCRDLLAQIAGIAPHPEDRL